MAQVILESVSKTYPGNVVAVRDLSLDIADGEFVVLVGPSGCGKSTTLRMIAGLEEITAGTIRIGDQVVNRVHPKDRDIAMVFQNYALYPHMTVYRNMAFGLKLRKVPRSEIDRRVRETAELLGIEDLLDRKPRALSGGQRQRVAVGRAIVRDPRCFLFDEPLSNLDAKLRTQMRAELKALHMRLRTTTVYVTHDQEEAMTLGDRVVVMEGGELQQVGPPLETYRRPVNRFVAGFVGAPSMNFLDGRLERVEEQLVFRNSHGVELGVEDDESLRGRDGDAVVLGVRPEAIRPADENVAAPRRSMTLSVALCEPLGDRVDVFATTAGDERIVARVAAATAPSPGETRTFTVDAADMHLFEPGTHGRHLLHG